MSSEKSVQIRHVVTPDKLAVAMAIEARDALPDAWTDEFEGEDPRLAAYVGSMSKVAALKALRSCLWAYGDLSWPDDYPSGAYRAALDKARRWMP